MKKRGFTLIELLAVIVILALISLIAIPIIVNIITKAKKSAFLDSAYGIMKSAEAYYSEAVLEGIVEDKTFLFDQDNELKYSGTKPQGGILLLSKKGEISLAFYNHEYCVLKSKTDKKITIQDYEENKCIIPDHLKDPMIILKGEKEVRVKIGETYNELGVEAKTVEGNKLEYKTIIKKDNEIVENIDTNSLGIYTITYIVESNGKKVEVSRTVKIVDGIGPVITFETDTVTLKETEVSTYDIYTGVSVVDNIDGEIEANSNNIKTRGELKAEVGTYTIIYEVTDSDLNKTEKERTFIVEEADNPILNFSNIGSERWTKEQTIKITASDVTNITSFSYEIMKEEISVEKGNVEVTGKSGEKDIILDSDGIYRINLEATNDFKKTSKVTSSTYKIDVTKPTITMSNVTIKDTQVSGYNLMTGVTVSDNSGVIPTVKTTGTISTTPKSYTITYTVTDEAGNITTKTRTITVQASTGWVVADTANHGSVGNVPVLNGLVAVKYRTTSDQTNKWYDYDKQMWANAVAVNSSYRNAKVGTVIPESAILAYFVWIPRYEYKYTNLGDSYAGGTQTQPGEIGINFITTTKTSPSTNYKIHPAFTFGSKRLSGIWVGKFEPTGSSTSPTIKPNLSSLRSQKVSIYFVTAQKFSASGNIYGINTSADAHMMKNSEWGAVAYLSQSKYGKRGNTSYAGLNKEVYRNNNSNYITGCSGGTSSATASSNCDYTYEKELNGTGASTTGTIYGVYDMNGGAHEYVMGVYNKTISSSGFSSLPDPKYYDNYTTNTLTTACSGGICYGHGLSETSGWFTARSFFVTSIYPWVRRGDAQNTFSRNSMNVFSFSYQKGEAFKYVSSRFVLAG